MRSDSRRVATASGNGDRPARIREADPFPGRIDLDSVSKTLRDAGRHASDMDAILIGGRFHADTVGYGPVDGAHRTDTAPGRASRSVRGLGCGRACLPLGRAEHFQNISGRLPLVRHFLRWGERGGYEYPHCYRPIIRRNTPLPLTRTESYFTGYPFQTEAKIEVYQGDDEDALKNILVGDFSIEGLTAREEPVEILCRMRLDLDGILEVTRRWKSTPANRSK